MITGYSRLSTVDESLYKQRDALARARCENVFEDRGVSGTTTVRAGHDSAFSKIAAGDASDGVSCRSRGSS
ncbi:MAG: recombinase family protein [Roseomonas sp.]|nr:recombinase family protein [Roseomonas sp.]MCA3315685.1 recombinase family protein [Roseomonas sp.]MCA3320917.1 recombinase family protein [Roseomonas sp.]